eukprot:7270050-Pyramimonas_sp.AAC.1
MQHNINNHGVAISDGPSPEHSSLHRCEDVMRRGAVQRCNASQTLLGHPGQRLKTPGPRKRARTRPTDVDCQ